MIEVNKKIENIDLSDIQLMLSQSTCGQLMQGHPLGLKYFANKFGITQKKLKFEINNGFQLDMNAIKIIESFYMLNIQHCWKDGPLAYYNNDPISIMDCRNINKTMFSNIYDDRTHGNDLEFCAEIVTDSIEHNTHRIIVSVTCGNDIALFFVKKNSANAKLLDLPQEHPNALLGLNNPFEVPREQYKKLFAIADLALNTEESYCEAMLEFAKWSENTGVTDNDWSIPWKFNHMFPELNLAG